MLTVAELVSNVVLSGFVLYASVTVTQIARYTLRFHTVIFPRSTPNLEHCSTSVKAVSVYRAF